MPCLLDLRPTAKLSPAMAPAPAAPAPAAPAPEAEVNGAVTPVTFLWQFCDISVVCAELIYTAEILQNLNKLYRFRPFRFTIFAMKS